MAKPVHSMIRVFDEAKSLDFYARAFGLEIADRLKFPDFALIYLRHPSSPFEVELTVNFDRKEPYLGLSMCAWALKHRSTDCAAVVRCFVNGIIHG